MDVTENNTSNNELEKAPDSEELKDKQEQDVDVTDRKDEAMEDETNQIPKSLQCESEKGKQDDIPDITETRKHGKGR